MQRRLTLTPAATGHARAFTTTHSPEERSIMSPINRTASAADLAQQRAYTNTLRAQGFKFGLTMAEAFVRGIRDLGYKHTGTALDELIDNAIQAGANTVGILLGFNGGSTAKPTDLAIIDDGHGMDPEMIRMAVIWGGTHREGDRTGFGRYGYGLPSASVSQGRAFTVYSAVADGRWHKVTVDLDAIQAGAYTVNGEIVVEEPAPAEIPTWIVESNGGHLPEHGTIVVIERLDRLTWKTAGALRDHLAEHFGIVYRNALDEVTITIDGARVEIVDPLFQIAGARYAGEPPVGERLPAAVIPVADTESGEVLGEIVVRYGYMHPSTTKGIHKQERLRILKEHNGFIVLRNGRQMDVVTRNPFLTLLSNDRYWQVEIDFPASLDEEFSVTTSKQQVRLSDRLWEILEEAGIKRTISHLKSRYDVDNAEMKAAKDAGEDGARSSEEAMQRTGEFATSDPDPDPDRDQDARDEFERTVTETAEREGRPSEDVERDLIAVGERHRYVVRVEAAPDAPFYRVEQVGSQRHLVLNSAHRWYTDLYAGPESTPRLRAALEVMLLVFGDCEADAGGQRRLFYASERVEWSRRLAVALDILAEIDGIDEQAPAEEALALA